MQITDPQHNSFMINRQEEEMIRMRQEQMREPKEAQLRRLRQENTDMEMRHPGVHDLNQDRNLQLQRERRELDRTRFDNYNGNMSGLQERIQEDQRRKYRDFQEEIARTEMRRNNQGL